LLPGCLARLAFILDFASNGRRTAGDRTFQVRHFYRGQCRFESFVSHLQPGAIDRLLERVASENAERVWHPGLLRRLSNSARNFVDDNVVMRGVASQQAAQTDNGVVFSGLSQGACRGRDLKGSWDANYFDVVLFCPGTDQAVICTAQQPIGDELVES